MKSPVAVNADNVSKSVIYDTALIVPLLTANDSPVKFNGTPRSSWTSTVFKYPAAHFGGKEEMRGYARSKMFL
jgi:hypothetical protein